jgi:uncharacterized protein
MGSNGDVGDISVGCFMDHIMKRKIILAGGSGYIGSIVAKEFSAAFDVVILSRRPKKPTKNIRTVVWDGQTRGKWIDELEGAYLLINLNGKNVNCRYTESNKAEILMSRIAATKVLGEAVQQLADPPRTWIQLASATIYRHSTDKAMDEVHGEIGEGFSVDVCTQWESCFNDIDVPKTRKVILRTTIVMGKSGGAFPRLWNLARLGMGAQGTGKQMVSWIHEDDLVGVIKWVAGNNRCSGVYNAAAPNPLTNNEMMRILSFTCGAPLSFSTPVWLLKFGAWIIGTETELVLKSRWVVPRRLEHEGFQFLFPTFREAAAVIAS